MNNRLIFRKNCLPKALIINRLIVFWTVFSNRSKKLGKICRIHFQVAADVRRVSFFFCGRRSTLPPRPIASPLMFNTLTQWDL